MSNVHKNDRKPSKFEVMDHAVILKKMLRELSIDRNFGYKVRESREPKNFSAWSEKSKERWRAGEAARLKKLEYLDRAFLMDKRRQLDAEIMRLMYAISDANEIARPVCMRECDDRRANQNMAIKVCGRIRIILQDIMDTLPIDKNWMTQVEPAIEAEIALLKGWRKSDGPMRKAVMEAEKQRGRAIISQGLVDAAGNDAVLRAVCAALNISVGPEDEESPGPSGVQG